MGSKSGSSEPVATQFAQVPQAPSYSAQIQDYITNYPKLFELQKQYGPQETQFSLDLLKQFGLPFAQELAGQQKELTPYTYGLQEQLAKMASDNSASGIPDSLRGAYLDEFRSEIGPNAGSGIGADYVSNNMVKAGESYRNYYQNLGLSLLNRVPVSTMSAANPGTTDTRAGIGNLMSYNASTYGPYVNNYMASWYPKTPSNSGSGGFNMSGALGGATSGASLGSMAGPWGTAIGAIAGGAMGGFGGGR